MLTSTDLLKNFLFSQVARSQTDLKSVKEQWNKITGTVGSKEFPVFLRYFLMATRRQLTKEYLFKEIKSFIQNADQVAQLLDQLEFYAYNYNALGSPDDEAWIQDKDSRQCIAILKTFKVTQWKPLALVAMERLSMQDGSKLLQTLVAISYRYNVIAKLQTNEMEKAYSRLAIRLHQGKITTLTQVLQELKTSVYVNDEDFKNYFTLRRFNTQNSADKKLVRYTLYMLESAAAGGSAYNFETDSGTLEHVLPEHYTAQWQAVFSEEEYERNLGRIGNLTLLEPEKNRQAADRDFVAKKAIYSTSKYLITSSIQDPDWNSQTIDARQRKLAKMAVGKWRI